MRIPLFHVDAFASEVFRGNPAGVCPLEAWLPDAVMQSIAMENALPETAFLVGGGGRYDIRWFTPETEVELCGHATLASAHVLFGGKERGAETIAFASKGGPLRVDRRGDLLALDLPSRPPEALPSLEAIRTSLAAALGAAPRDVLAARDYLAVFDHEDEVRALAPDMARVAALDRFAVIVTAKGRDGGDVDFVSRFFAPAKGIPEDPVTGSAHCTLVPYWSSRLGKDELRARQLSRRGGDLACELRGDRVSLAGRAVLYLEGTITL